MPLYEYECERCGHRFERIQKFSDPPVETCPKCGGPVHKLQSAPAFQFKGTGWYVTDYARSGSGGGRSEAGTTEKSKDASKTTSEGTASSSSASSSGSSSASSSSSSSPSSSPTSKSS